MWQLMPVMRHVVYCHVMCHVLYGNVSHIFFEMTIPTHVLVISSSESQMDTETLVFIADSP